MFLGVVKKKKKRQKEGIICLSSIQKNLYNVNSQEDQVFFSKTDSAGVK